MKKSIFLFTSLISSVITFAQSPFDKYEDMEQVTSAVVSGKMFKIMSNIQIESNDQEVKDYMDIAKSITGLQFFTTESAAIAKQMENDVKSYLRNGKLEELMRVKDKDVNLKFYVMEGKRENHVNELLMYIDGFQENIKISRDNSSEPLKSVLVRLTGDIDLNKIQTLTKRMNLPKELNKASE